MKEPKTKVIVQTYTAFFALKGVRVTAIMTKLMDGGWLPFAVSAVLALVMSGWRCRRQRKPDYDMANGVTVDSLAEILSAAPAGTGRKAAGAVPLLYCTATQDPLPPMLCHHVRTLRFLHRVTVFLTVGSVQHVLENPNDGAGLTAADEEVAVVDEAVSAGVVPVLGRTRLEARRA
ncbi:putative potassium transporter 4 [Panicum miliaceum]|uniref:Potassium transporter 4 n=1 Tax=Panicum miliaceum TaxID=4540 RepID=A0A3L6RYJ1_PANMI|nr:putative potassium transporter 4 [Panicum miliaceum]